MQRRIKLALAFSALIHLSFIVVLAILAYLTPAGVLGGGGKGGVIVVSLIEGEGDGVAKGVPAPHAPRDARTTRGHARVATPPPPNAPGTFKAPVPSAPPQETTTAGGDTRDARRATESGSGGARENPGEGGGEGGGAGGGVGPATGRGDATLSEIWRKINRAKYYPWHAKRNGWEGAPRVSFQIDAQGAITWVRLVASCGIPELDEAALETVRRAAPLPHHPKPITLAIRFSLSDSK